VSPVRYKLSFLSQKTTFFFAQTVSKAGGCEVWLNATDDVNSTETEHDKCSGHTDFLLSRRKKSTRHRRHRLTAVSAEFNRLQHLPCKI
jgi:hypothetical protein